MISGDFGIVFVADLYFVGYMLLASADFLIEEIDVQGRRTVISSHYYTCWNLYLTRICHSCYRKGFVNVCDDEIHGGITLTTYIC